MNQKQLDELRATIEKLEALFDEAQAQGDPAAWRHLLGQIELVKQELAQMSRLRG